MVMGNASGREAGEGSSGVHKDEHEEEIMKCAQHGTAHAGCHAQGAYPLQIPRVCQSPLMFVPQGPLSPLARPGDIMQVLNHARMQNAAHCKNPDSYDEKMRATMIRWSHGGNQVAITGSWDNWATIEGMQSLGKEFVVVKMLPLGVYHYRFIVDGRLQYAPDSPWEFDGSRPAYNVLDLQEYIPEAPRHLAEFESPPSPSSSYANESLHDADFSKPPPELPPQLQMTSLNEAPQSSATARPCLPRFHHTALNHLYVQNNQGGASVALGSTFRFRQKYVNVVLYKASRRSE